MRSQGRLTGQREGEVQACQHDGGEDIPSQQADHERYSASRNQQGVGSPGIALSEMIICASQAAKGRHKQAQDAEEDEICAKSTDGVDETEYTHEELEKGEARIEALRFEAEMCCGGVGRVGRVSTPGVCAWNEGEGEGDPEGAEGSEDDEGKSVAEDPL